MTGMAARRARARHPFVVAFALAIGLVLMHGGFDPAVSGGHHLGADHHLSATTAAPADRHGGDHGEHDTLGTVAGICAVFALVAVALVVRRSSTGDVIRSDRLGGRRLVDGLAASVAPSPSRVSLCIERC
jgi:hypothetical protein